MRENCASKPFVSIIIPTYRDWSRLDTCLDALKKQTYPDSCFEIIVVNNCVGDDPPADFDVPNNCKLTTEARPGSYAARNKGLEIAKGDILGFTDSDCIPSPNWIEQAVYFFDANHTICRLGGQIKLFYKSHKLTSAELYEKYYAFRQREAAAKGVSVTGNMFAKSEMFEVVGPFNDHLMSGGDNEWSLRAQSLGYDIEYAQEVIISHPARHSMYELLQKAVRVAGGKAKLPKIKYIFLIKCFVPPFDAFMRINNEGSSVIEIFKLFFIKYRIKLAMGSEVIKVLLGKVPSR